MQLACCHLISEKTGKELKHSALVADGCSPRFLWHQLKRKLLLQLTYEGEDYEFNFSPFDRNCKWSLHTTEKRLVWQIVAANKDALVQITLYSLLQHMFSLNYENPDGSRPGKLWSTGSAIGKLNFYRKTDSDKELVDTLRMKDVLCIVEDTFYS